MVRGSPLGCCIVRGCIVLLIWSVLGLRLRMHCRIWCHIFLSMVFYCILGADAFGFFSSFSHNLHMTSSCWFLWLGFSGAILLQCYTMALHCFLLSLFMCSGRFPGVAVALLSARSLTLDFTRASISTVHFICSAILISSSFLWSVSFLERFLQELSVHSLSW